MIMDATIEEIYPGILDAFVPIVVNILENSHVYVQVTELYHVTLKQETPIHVENQSR